MCVETFLTELEESRWAACAGVSSPLWEVLVRNKRPPELAWAAGVSGGALIREEGHCRGGGWTQPWDPRILDLSGPRLPLLGDFRQRPPAASQEMW